MMKTQQRTILFCGAALMMALTCQPALGEEDGGDQTRLVFGLVCAGATRSAGATSSAAMSDHCAAGKGVTGAVMLVDGKAAAITNDYGQFVVQARPSAVISALSPAAQVTIPPRETLSRQMANALNALLAGPVDATSLIGLTGMLLVISSAAIGLLLHSVSQGLARVAQAAEALGHDERQSRVERDLKRDTLGTIAMSIADLTGQPVTLLIGTGVVTVTASPPAWKAVAADGREFYFSLRPRLESGDKTMGISRQRQADVAAMWRFLAAQRGYQVAVPTRARWTLVIRDPQKARDWSWRRREWARARRITKAVRALVIEPSQSQPPINPEPQGELT